MVALHSCIWNFEGKFTQGRDSALSVFALTLKIAHIKERLWSIRSHCSINLSCRSLQKSDHERIALDFFKKDRPQRFACDSGKSLSKNDRFARKNVFFKWLLQFFTVSPLFMLKSESLPSLFAQLLFYRVTVAIHCRRHRERIAPVYLYNSATVSDLLPSFMTKEHSLFFTSKKNKKTSYVFTEKTDERIPNPDYSIYFYFYFLYFSKIIQNWLFWFRNEHKLVLSICG